MHCSVVSVVVRSARTSSCVGNMRLFDWGGVSYADTFDNRLRCYHAHAHGVGGFLVVYWLYFKSATLKGIFSEEFKSWDSQPFFAVRTTLIDCANLNH